MNQHLIAQWKGQCITVSLIAHDSTDTYADLTEHMEESDAKQLIEDLEYGRQLAFDLQALVTLNATQEEIGSDWIGRCIYPTYQDCIADVLHSYDMTDIAIADALTHDFTIYNDTIKHGAVQELQNFNKLNLEVK